MLFGEYLKLRASRYLVVISLILLLFIILAKIPFFPEHEEDMKEGTGLKLPEPRMKGEMSVEEALRNRRSIREYQQKAVKLQDLSQILWAAQGITSSWGGRTAPSAGATYPLEVYVVVRNVSHLKKGIYHYIPQNHSLLLLQKGDFSQQLMRASLNQKWVGDAAFNLVIAAAFSRTTRVYGERGIRYVYLEAGHAAQNVYLQVTALGLGCVVVGAFNDEMVKAVVGIPADQKPIYVIPVGVPKD